MSWFLESVCNKVRMLLRKLGQRAGRKAEATRNVTEHTGWLESRAVRGGLGREVWAIMLQFPEQRRHDTGHLPVDQCPVCLLASTFAQENLWAPLVAHAPLLLVGKKSSAFDTQSNQKVPLKIFTPFQRNWIKFSLTKQNQGGILNKAVFYVLFQVRM